MTLANTKLTFARLNSFFLPFFLTTFGSVVSVCRVVTLSFEKELYISCKNFAAMLWARSGHMAVYLHVYISWMAFDRASRQKLVFFFTNVCYVQADIPLTAYLFRDKFLIFSVFFFFSVVLIIRQRIAMKTRMYCTRTSIHSLRHCYILFIFLIFNFLQTLSGTCCVWNGQDWRPTSNSERTTMRQKLGWHDGRHLYSFTASWTWRSGTTITNNLRPSYPYRVAHWSVARVLKQVKAMSEMSEYIRVHRWAVCRISVDIYEQKHEAAGEPLGAFTSWEHVTQVEKKKHLYFFIAALTKKVRKKTRKAAQGGQNIWLREALNKNELDGIPNSVPFPSTWQ